MRVLNVIKKGNRIQYYECMDNAGNIGKLTKAQLIAEIDAGNVENAKVQRYYGSDIVRISDDKPKKSVEHKSNSNYYHNYTTRANNRNQLTSIIYGKAAVDRLIRTEIGTPLRVRTSDYSKFEQVIFAGIKNLQSREAFVFFTGNAFSNTFALTASFIENNTTQVQFDFDNNDPVEVTKLLGMIGND